VRAVPQRTAQGGRTSSSRLITMSWSGLLTAFFRAAPVRRPTTKRLARLGTSAQA